MQSSFGHRTTLGKTKGDKHTGCSLCWLFASLALVVVISATTAIADTAASALNSEGREESRQCQHHDDPDACESSSSSSFWGGTTCGSGNKPSENGSLRDFLQTTVFGQSDGSSIPETETNDNPRQQESENFPKPFLTFLEDRRKEKPVISYLQDRFSGNNTDTETGAAVGNNPFFSFMDGIMQTKASILGETGKQGSSDTNSNEKILAQVLEKARVLTQKEETMDMKEFLSSITDALKKVAKQFQDNFGELLATNIDAYIARAIPAFAVSEDAKNSPLVKRKLHRFYQTVTKDEWIDLHDALYLSQLAYVNTIEQFDTGIEAFENNSWKRLYGTTQSLTDLPANFLLIHKELDPLETSTSGDSKKKYNKGQQPSPLESLQQTLQKFAGKPQETEVLVTLIVRGTKDVSDFLQDGLLEPEEYRGGYAHGGILASGKKLAEQYLPKLRDLHEITSN